MFVLCLHLKIFLKTIVILTNLLICFSIQENILSHMHTLVARNEHDDACTAKHCISHQKFAMQIIEQVFFFFHHEYTCDLDLVILQFDP